MSAQQLWLDAVNRNGTYVQPFINIRGQVDGVDEANEIRYELRVSGAVFYRLHELSMGAVDDRGSGSGREEIRASCFHRQK